MRVVPENLKELVTKGGSFPVSEDVASGLLSASIPFDYHLHQTHKKSSLLVNGVAPVVSLVKGLHFDW